MLVIALILDALFGEPDALWRRAPHPAVLIGRSVGWLDARLNRGTSRRARGAAALAALMLGWGAAAALLAAASFGGAIEVVGAAVLLAQRSLMEHVLAVARGLRVSLEEGRREVAKIVGRDPVALDGTGVARGAIESAAENFSDGVVAPAFWFLAFGLPGIAVYKAVNTADSMIGHRSERHREFGWAAARFDDLLNWVPARLSAVLICAARGGGAAWAVVRRDARLHRSPNAGWPEAAVAGALAISLSGPRVYDGVWAEEPCVNPEGRPPHIGDVEEAVALLWRAWGLLLAAAALIWALGALV